MSDEPDEKEMNERLEALDKKLQKLAPDPKPTPDNKEPKSRQEVMKAGASAGVEFAGAIILSTFFGIWLDKQLDLAPLFMLVFLVLGAGVAFYNLYRQSQNL